VAASCAALQDLSSVFADRWKFLLGKKNRVALKAFDWKKKDLSLSAILAVLPTELPVSLTSTLTAFLTPEQLKSNRDAARRVLELAGSVRIKIDGEISEVKDVKLLPVHPFSVVKISFDWGNKRSNDDALVCVKSVRIEVDAIGWRGKHPRQRIGSLEGDKISHGVSLGRYQNTDSGIDTSAMLPALERHPSERQVCRQAGRDEARNLTNCQHKGDGQGGGDIEDRIAKTACRSVTMSKERVRCLAGYRFGGMHSL